MSQSRITIPSSEQMYAAVKSRDIASDGQFVYGVVTTGVYCKPSCGARLAKPENVRFFPACADAESAGFRACKKCDPANAQRDLKNLIEVARYIESHADDRLTLDSLSRLAKLSPARLQKNFKAAFGVSPKAYQDAARLGRLKQALKSGSDVTDAIYAAGFGSSSRVYGEAARTMGMTPKRYRAGGEGETLYYAYRNSSLGPLLMAATARGVCFAQFGESKHALLDQLKDEFPGATCKDSPQQDESYLDQWIEALEKHLTHNAPRPDLPLDLRGTAFQLAVWKFLLSIREGDVVSYSEVAKGIGSPRAVRAAATACGANRVGVLVPCHRVLRGDGGIGGYRWGIERKRTLLDLERRNRAAST